jgi:mannose-6-phosphate isomerase-like protein (cupin superfamily)
MATFFLDEHDEREVGPDQVVVVPAGVWHGFINSGDRPLRQIDIHVSSSFDTEWR